MPQVSELSVLPVLRTAPALTDYLVCQVQNVHGEPQSALVPIGLVSTGGSLVNNSTPIASGAADQLLYDKGGTLGELGIGPGLSIVGGLLVSDSRTILTANTNYYVSTTGSDSNPGTISEPWLTLQHAMDFIAANIDIAGFFITVNIGAGTFEGVVVSECVGGGIIQWEGAGVASTTVKTSSGAGNFTMVIRTNTAHGVDNITFNNLGVPNNALMTFGGGQFVIGNAPASIFGIGTNHCDVALVGNSSSDIGINGSGGIVTTAPQGTGNGITVSGAFAWVIALDVQGQLQNGTPWVLVGTPTFNIFVVVSDQAMLSDYAATYTGAGIGQRFNVANGGNINGGFETTGLLGPNLYPGTIAGFCDQISSYDGFIGTGLNYPQSTMALRTVLTANTNFYVSTTGSDSNDGSSGSPWATPQHAANTLAASYDLAGFTAYVNIGAGTFTGSVNIPSCVGGGCIQFTGAGTASTTIVGNSGRFTGVFNLIDNNETIVGIDAMTLNNGVSPSNSSSGVVVGALATVYLGDFNSFAGVGLVFECTVNDSLVPFIFTLGGAGFPGAILATPTNFAVTGTGVSKAFGFFVAYSSVFSDYGNWTVGGTLTVTKGWAAVQDNGVYNGQSTGPWTGSATGPRFVGINGGVYDGSQTSPGVLGPNWFPGSTPGTLDSTSGYDGFQGPLPGINTQTTNYTLALSDAFEIVEMNDASANTLTVPPNSSVAFPVGTKIWVTQFGAGNTTVAAGAGVTVHNAGLLGGQWKSAKLYQRAVDEWVQTNV